MALIRGRRRQHVKLVIVLLLAMLYCLYFTDVNLFASRKYFDPSKYPLLGNFTELMKIYKQYGQTNVSPINEHPYSFREILQDKCEQKKVTSLLILVKSLPQHFDRRMSIRETWGNESVSGFSVKTVFFVGEPSSPIRFLLNAEKKRFNDVIELSFNDEDYGSTLKTVAAIDWTSKYCNNSDFILLVNDDFYVATNSLIQHLYSKTEGKHTDIRRIFMGHLSRKQPAVREQNQKYFLRHEEYEFDFLPTFIHSGALVMSMTTVTDLNIAIPFVKYVRIDDIFLAIVISKLGIVPENNGKFFVNEKINYHENRFKTLLVSSGYSNGNEMREAWATHH